MAPKTRKPRVRKAKAPRKGAKKASNSNVRDFASLSVNRSFTVPGSPNITANNMYSLMNTALDQYQRAIQVAQAYQYYRIKNVALKIKPQFDTYTFNAGSGSTAQGYGKPKLYSMLDKSGSIPTTVTLENLKQMGARPRNLDEKPLNISWAPTVLTDSMTAPGGGTQPGQYKVSPWLTTSANTVSPGVWNANTIDHLGVYFYVESTSYGGTGGLPYQVDVEVQFEFKKPLWSAVGSTAAIGIVPAVLDASPDGVEGGSDGISIPILH